MTRVLLFVAYDGTAYSGWQSQNNAVTVEAKLTQALEELTGEVIHVIGGSRTDAGVHALCNVAVFDTQSRIPPEKFAFALNQRLPEDIRIKQSMEVDGDFHPRHCNTTKTYEYQIQNAKIPDPGRRLYAHFTHMPLDVAKMRQAASYFIGTHDFKSFCAAQTKVPTTVRTIYKLNVEKEGEMIYITVSGNGFLYNMVRIMAGTLMEVGAGRIPPEKIPEILKAKDRAAAGPTAPAKGLTLMDYHFDDY